MMTDASPSIRQKLLAKSWLLLYLPAVWAFISYVQGAAPQPVPRGPEKPALAFNQYLVDLGPVPPQRFVHAFFQFTNRGTADVDVTGLVPSCGCLRPQLEKKHYAPGETGEFFLKVETALEEPGPHEYFVDVNYTDPEPRSARVTFKVTLPSRQVLVEPPGLVFYQLSPVSSTREVVITNFRPQPLTVKRVTCTSKYAHAEVVSSERDSDGLQTIKLNVTVPGDVPPGRHSGLVQIMTDDPEFSEIGVYVLIQTPERGVRMAGHEEERGGEGERGRE